MILSLSPTFWLLLAAALAMLAAAAYFRRLRWRPAFALRGLLLGLLLLAALQPEKRTTIEPPPMREVLVLDQSDSVSPEVRGEARARARQWREGGANRLVILVGADSLPVAGGALEPPDGSATDLAGAIELASAYLGNEPGRLVLATDGRPDDPLEVRRALDNFTANAPGHTVEWIFLQQNAFPTDIFAGELYVPAALWENTVFTALLPVTTFLPGDVQLEVSVNETIVLSRTINLPAGQHLIPLSLQTSVTEIMTIAAAVNAAGDPRPENNAVYSAVQVFEAPRVLLVTEDAAQAGAFSQALASAGLDADLTLPEDMPGSLSALSVYQVILIDNILSGAFSDGQLQTLKDFVQQQGRGLVFTGGRNAFTLGGYKDSVIEPILPVRLEPPPREQDSPLTLVLVIDRSASMDGARGTPTNLRPISLAREAALRSVETLGPEDYLGILSYNANAVWSLPLQQVGAGDMLQNAKNAMAQISPSGGTAIYNALTTAVSELAETTTSETRHIVLLSDGNDETPLEEYAALAEYARSLDITISTIALGVEADQALMALLAEAGQGRYYPVLQATDLPRILIDETRAARDENVRTGTSRAVPGEAAHPVLSGLDAGGMPVLLGYNALESKSDQGAEDVLLSAGFEDPLLSVWQFGLGRVATWTGDLGREWAPDWAAWENWGRFWGNIIRYTLPDPALGPGEVDVIVGVKDVQVNARVANGAGLPQNGVPVEFAIVDSSGQIVRYIVPQVGPGEYSLTFPKPAAGAYRAVVRYIDEDGLPVEFAAPVVVNYKQEWQPAPGIDVQDFGTLVTWNDLLQDAGSGERIALSPNEILQRIMIVLIVTWPIEIAVRRRKMPWR